MSDEQRRQQVQAFNRVLNTPDGKMLMDEIELLTNPRLGKNPQETGYYLGRHSVFQELKRLQESVIHE